MVTAQRLTETSESTKQKTPDLDKVKGDKLSQGKCYVNLVFRYDNC